MSRCSTCRRRRRRRRRARASSPPRVGQRTRPAARPAPEFSALLAWQNHVRGTRRSSSSRAPTPVSRGEIAHAGGRSTGSAVRWRCAAPRRRRRRRRARHPRHARSNSAAASDDPRPSCSCHRHADIAARPRRGLGGDGGPRHRLGRAPRPGRRGRRTAATCSRASEGRWRTASRAPDVGAAPLPAARRPVLIAHAAAWVTRKSTETPRRDPSTSTSRGPSPPSPGRETSRVDRARRRRQGSIDVRPQRGIHITAARAAFFSRLASTANDVAGPRVATAGAHRRRDRSPRAVSRRPRSWRAGATRRAPRVLFHGRDAMPRRGVGSRARRSNLRAARAEVGQIAPETQESRTRRRADAMHSWIQRHEGAASVRPTTKHARAHLPTFRTFHQMDRCGCDPAVPAARERLAASSSGSLRASSTTAAGPTSHRTTGTWASLEGLRLVRHRHRPRFATRITHSDVNRRGIRSRALPACIDTVGSQQGVDLRSRHYGRSITRP